jgi:formate dehydrogenase iron-sulfur subunit
MSYAKLIDTKKCIGCKACQVICKEWNGLEGVATELPEEGLGLTNPPRLDSQTYMLLTHHEIDDPDAPGGFQTVFVKQQCMHCDEPACVSACPVSALEKTPEGPVVYDVNKCIGCRYCMLACPFGAISSDWSSLTPKISKCTLCADRLPFDAPSERNGETLSAEEVKLSSVSHSMPACVQACPADALDFGDRDEMLAKAKARIAGSNGAYVDHIYGEKEAGGTATFYLSAVPFAKLGMPDVGTESYPARSVVALKMVPPAVIGVGALLGGIYAWGRRVAAVAVAEGGDAHHVEFGPVRAKLWTPVNVLLAVIMAFGAFSFVARFALGLGGSTALSDTWGWGLWIVFDLVWIAVAAGAFAAAGIIYVFRRKDLYALGRSAVLIGLLSYSFVTVTLLADLGLPWHFWQLGVQSPEHSAMFEVSWCVSFYVTILALEFMPVVFEHLHMPRAMERWKNLAPLWVVVAVTVFVWLLSRNPIWTGLTFGVFALLAWAFRPRAGEEPVPIMLAIAAVTLSTMHQSSLGALYLLVPDKLDPAWWSPLLPVYFFLSAVAAGLSLLILATMWIPKAWGRKLPRPQLASLGTLAFWALLVYMVLRIGDLAARGQIRAAFAGPKAGIFTAEIVLAGLLPLVLLGTKRLRANPKTLFWGALLACGGVVLNRTNVVVYALDLKGPIPQLAPQPYAPSVYEWGLSIGLIAATIFLFGWAVRKLPILPKAHSEPHG